MGRNRRPGWRPGTRAKTKASESRRPKYRCSSCTVLIGQGYRADEIWYDPSEDRFICPSCADWLRERPTYRVVTREELVTTQGGAPLLQLLRRRAVEVRAHVTLSGSLR